MNGVAPALPAEARSSAAAAPSMTNGTQAPRPEGVAGRGRSAGSSATGAPARCSRQKASEAWQAPDRSVSRFQAAKSPKRTGSRGSAAGPAPRGARESLRSSSTKTPIDPPSAITWWTERTRSWCCDAGSPLAAVPPRSISAAR